MKVPAKIKIFLWLVMWNRTLTKDNLRKKGWEGSNQCMFCASDESICHLFFLCPVARLLWGILQCASNSPQQPTSMEELGVWINSFQGFEKVAMKVFLAAMFWVLWKTRNKACFEYIMPTDPCDIIYHICYVATDWAELQKPKAARALRRGTEVMKMVTRDVFSRARGWNPLCQRIDSG